MNRKSSKSAQQRGFTIMQMVITLAIISIVSVFGVLGIRNARAEFRLQNNARLFATYVEKARVDAIRRHAPDGSESSVETFGPGTASYAVTMDFGSGAVETRNYALESGLSFSTSAKKVSFNWRGRISEAWVFQIFSTYLARSLPVDVSGSGDITVGEQHFPDQLIPPIILSGVTGDVPTPTPTPAIQASPSPNADPTPTPTPSPSPTSTPGSNGNGNGNGNNGNGNGNGNGNNASPTPTPSPSPSPSPTATSTPIPCVGSLSVPLLSLSQSDATKKTGTVTYTLSNATGSHTISASQEGNGNSMSVSISPSAFNGNGSSVITVTSKNGAGNRGSFILDISASPTCGTTQKLTVSVSN